jgi:hypothetical protein
LAFGIWNLVIPLSFVPLSFVIAERIWLQNAGLAGSDPKNQQLTKTAKRVRAGSAPGPAGSVPVFGGSMPGPAGPDPPEPGPLLVSGDVTQVKYVSHPMKQMKPISRPRETDETYFTKKGPNETYFTRFR